MLDICSISNFAAIIFLFLGGTGLPTLGGIGGRGGNVCITCKEQVPYLLFLATGST